MVSITFTYYAKKLPTGQHQVHLFIKDLEPTWDGTPRGERMAMRDAADVVKQIVGTNLDPEKHENLESRLVQDGEPDSSYFPVFMFVIGVTWNKAAQCAHYTRVCYERYEWDAKWNPIASLGMEHYDYTMSCLKKYERKRIAVVERSVAL